MLLCMSSGSIRTSPGTLPVDCRFACRYSPIDVIPRPDASTIQDAASTNFLIRWVSNISEQILIHAPQCDLTAWWPHNWQ